MSKEKARHGYGPRNALPVDTVEEIKARSALALETVDFCKGFTYPSKLNPSWLWLETPNLPDTNYYHPIFYNLCDEAVKFLHPDLLRKTCVVRYVPDIFLRDPASKRVMEASGKSIGTRSSADGDTVATLIEVSLSVLKKRSGDERRHWIYFAMRTIFHEIFEQDYNIRMDRGLIPISPKQSTFKPDYHRAAHEVYATETAERLIQTVFSDAPPDFRQRAFGNAGDREIKLQTTAMNQLSAAILRFLGKNS